MDVQQQLHYKKKILDIIEKYLPVCTVYLFGSRARNTNREGADIDIALDKGEPILYSVMVAIRNDIEDSTIPVFIDVVDVHAVSDQMREEIKKGIIWKK